METGCGKQLRRPVLVINDSPIKQFDETTNPSPGST